KSRALTDLISDALMVLSPRGSLRIEKSRRHDFTSVRGRASRYDEIADRPLGDVPAIGDRHLDACVSPRTRPAAHRAAGAVDDHDPSRRSLHAQRFNNERDIPGPSSD